MLAIDSPLMSVTLDPRGLCHVQPDERVAQIVSRRSKRVLGMAMVSAHDQFVFTRP